MEFERVAARPPAGAGVNWVGVAEGGIFGWFNGKRAWEWSAKPPCSLTTSYIYLLPLRANRECE